MTSHQGTSVFPGLAIAKAFYVRPTSLENVAFTSEAQELARLEAAIKRTETQIAAIKAVALDKVGAEEAQIFDAHLMILLDPEFLDGIRGEISNSSKSAVAAVKTVTDLFASMLSQAPTEYLRERVADLQDVSSRLTRNLDPSTSQEEMTEDFILIAEEMTPSDLMAASDRLKGVALVKGGLTSHAAILLKSLGIPAVFGLGTTLSLWGAAEPVILDAENGVLMTSPNAEMLKKFGERADQSAQEAKALTAWKTRTTQTSCGTKFLICANVGNQAQLEKALSQGADGVGLYRTEFLFMDRSSAPSEEEQYGIYKAALISMKGRPLTIRTLDIGGDKQISYLKMPQEENPFLGVRGLRLCLQMPDLFRTQIRALLRASAHGPLEIMFPMVTSPSEWLKAFELIDPLLKETGVQKDAIRWGMMLEIPSNIFMIPEFSKLASFFSVGTNDLTQYLTACDRENTELQELGDSSSPGVIRAFHHLATQTLKAGRPLSVCGEMASDALLAPFLLGCGVTKLSQNAALVARSRRDLSTVDLADCKALANRVIELSTVAEIKAELRSFREKHRPSVI